MFLLLFWWLKVLCKQFETDKPHLSWEEGDVLVPLCYTSHQHMPGNKRAPVPSWREQSQLLLPSHLSLPWTQHLHLLCPSPKQMCNIEGPPQAMFIKHQPNNLKYLSWKLLCELLGMAVLSLAATPDHSGWTEPWEASWGIHEPNTLPIAAQHDSPTPPSCATSKALIPDGTTSLSSNHDKKH